MTGSLRRRLAPLQRYSNTFGFAATPYARPVQSQKVEAEQSQPDTAIQNINPRRCANITANGGWNPYGGFEILGPQAGAGHARVRIAAHRTAHQGRLHRQPPLSGHRSASTTMPSSTSFAPA